MEKRKKFGVKIGTNGDLEVIEMVDYKTIQEAVGGTFDIISVTPKTTLWVHDEGLIIGLEPNPVASRVLWQLNPGYRGRTLVGPVFVTGGANECGDTLTLHQEGMDAINGARQRFLRTGVNGDNGDSFFDELGL